MRPPGRARRPEPGARRRHRRQPVHRALDAHARVASSSPPSAWAPQVVNLEVQLSSRVKGESMLDTIYTLESLHVDVFVIRDAEAGVPALVAAHVAPHVSVLSAGEAHVVAPDAGPARCADHPAAQAALRRTGGGHRRRHPPLARGALGLARAADARGARPAPRRTAGADARRRTSSPASRAARDLDAGLAGADVVMMLRIQKERMGAGGHPRRRRTTSATAA